MLLKLKAIPRSALILGWAGLIPFVFGGISIWIDIPINIKLGISQMTLTYGMIILSFLGGVRWGAAMVQSYKMDAALVLSVAPSLLAFATFFMPGQDASLALSIAFIDSNGVIISISDMKPMDTHGTASSGPAQYALEVNQGWYTRNGVNVGDKVEGIPAAGK